jgi:spore coat protein H
MGRIKCRLLILFVVFYSCSIDGFSKNLNPDFNQIFLQGEVSVIRLFMDETDKQQLLDQDNRYTDTYYRTDFQFENSLIDTFLENVGIRIRGKTSRGNPKLSFKIDFKEFGGEQFFKLKKLDLKPDNNDPSLMREYLTTLMYRKMEVPVARACYTEVYMNDEYMGIYLNVENIDDEFVDRRFGNEEGNLYKCSYGATLEPTNNIKNTSLFELKTNEEINDRSGLKNLISLLAEKDDGNWTKEIESVFDVDLYLRQLAVEAMVGHWDGYSCNINNYYLYENPETGKIIYIPYDMDNTWGIDWIGPDWGKRNLLKWSSDTYKTPLTTRILGVTEFNKQYIRYLYDVLGFFKDREYFDSIAYSLFELLTYSVESDDYYPKTYGYDIDDFLNSYYDAAGGHVEYSIDGYIDTRISYAEKQLPKITDIRSIGDEIFSVYPNPSNGDLLYVSGGNLNSDEINIYDAQGKSIGLSRNGNTILTFQYKLPVGIYILKYGIETRKFVVIN